eukprot:TRINITY_DN78862_c0_g1_i1.p3 TRINITY_DN78862_c0_g1~~TRINITY_DN78862_c0_g1_i1.p3  ORF type:complete len:122 (+),score=14.19 TRINITY_DN78862_c0_g1_i1:438-803(+)
MFTTRKTEYFGSAALRTSTPAREAARKDGVDIPDRMSTSTAKSTSRSFPSISAMMLTVLLTRALRFGDVSCVSILELYALSLDMKRPHALCIGNREKYEEQNRHNVPILQAWPLSPSQIHL